MSDEHKGGDLKFFIGLFIGGLVGACVIFFLGTKEGKKATKLLEEKGEEIKDSVKDKLVETKEVLTESATEKLDSALAHIEELQKHGRETTAELRKTLFKNLPKKH